MSLIDFSHNKLDLHAINHNDQLNTIQVSLINSYARLFPINFLDVYLAGPPEKKLRCREIQIK